MRDNENSKPKADKAIGTDELEEASNINMNENKEQENEE